MRAIEKGSARANDQVWAKAQPHQPLTTPLRARKRSVDFEFSDVFFSDSDSCFRGLRVVGMLVASVFCNNVNMRTSSETISEEANLTVAVGLEEFKFEKDQVTDFHKQIYCSDEVLMPFFCFLKAYPITACKLKLGDLEGAPLDTNFAMRDGEDNVKALFRQGQLLMGSCW
ncbi:unnamed protein product [Prunus armeniaca]